MLSFSLMEMHVGITVSERILNRGRGWRISSACSGACNLSTKHENPSNCRFLQENNNIHSCSWTTGVGSIQNHLDLVHSSTHYLYLLIPCRVLEDWSLSQIRLRGLRTGCQSITELIEPFTTLKYIFNDWVHCNANSSLTFLLRHWVMIHSITAAPVDIFGILGVKIKTTNTTEISPYTASRYGETLAFICSYMWSTTQQVKVQLSLSLSNDPEKEQSHLKDTEIFHRVEENGRFER